MADYGMEVRKSKDELQFTTQEGSLLVDLEARPKRLSITDYTFTSSPVANTTTTLFTIEHNLAYVPFVLCYIYAVDTGSLTIPRVQAGSYSIDPFYMGTGVAGVGRLYTVTDSQKVTVKYTVSDDFGLGITPPVNGSKWRFKVYVFSNQGLD